MPKVILEVRWGPSQGTKVVIAPGESLTVGRTERASLCFSHDAQMSARHFVLTVDQRACTLRDLGSARGTWHNGERVSAERPVASGDWIKAGDTVLSVYFEGATPPRPSRRAPGDAEAQQAREAGIALALSASARDGAPGHAILDAARDPRILELCRESIHPYRSLYDGIQGETLAGVAPHLIEARSGSRLLEALIREGWGQRWGIYLRSRLPFVELRRHLRRLLMVEEEETGQRMYFRFYDPLVARVFLPLCTPRQRAEVFGEIEELWMEGERGEPLFFEAAAR
jgi:hypothetical protein